MALVKDPNGWNQKREFKSTRTKSDTPTQEDLLNKRKLALWN